METQAVGLRQATASKAAPSSNKHCESVWMHLYVQDLFDPNKRIVDAREDSTETICARNLHQNRKVPSTTTSRDCILK
jgi:hypothetical protein